MRNTNYGWWLPVVTKPESPFEVNIKDLNEAVT